MRKMIKKLKNCVLFVAIFEFTAVSLLFSNVYAVELIDKNAKIDQEFGCIAKRQNADLDLDWSDVCYNESEIISDEMTEEPDEYAFNESTDYYAEYIEKYDSPEEDLGPSIIEEQAAYADPIDDFQITVYPDKVVANYSDEYDSDYDYESPEEEYDDSYVDFEPQSDMENYYEEDVSDYSYEEDVEREAEIAIESLGEYDEDMEWEEEAYKPRKTKSRFTKSKYSYSSDEFDGIEASFEATGGYRQDELNWTIAGTSAGTSPNILSELEWTDIQIFELQGKAEVVLAEHIVLDGIGGYGQIVGGDNQDSDFLGDNRTLEFSRSNNKTEDGNTLDLSGGVGFRIHLDQYAEMLESDKLHLTLLGGYSYHEQNLETKDGFQSLPGFGAFSGLDSRYETEWDGPWAGFSLFGQKDRFSGFVRFEYHWADYYAEADWNLRTDFKHPKSFEHEAEGRGYVFRTGGEYYVNDTWSFNFNWDIQSWETDAGVDRTFFNSGAILETQLNEVNWDSFALRLGATARF